MASAVFADLTAKATLGSESRVSGCGSAYIVEKGSIAVDGISLTVASLRTRRLFPSQ